MVNYDREFNTVRSLPALVLREIAVLVLREIAVLVLREAAVLVPAQRGNSKGTAPGQAA